MSNTGSPQDSVSYISRLQATKRLSVLMNYFAHSWMPALLRNKGMFFSTSTLIGVYLDFKIYSELLGDICLTFVVIEKIEPLWSYSSLYYPHQQFCPQTVGFLVLSLWKLLLIRAAHHRAFFETFSFLDKTLMVCSQWYLPSHFWPHKFLNFGNLFNTLSIVNILYNVVISMDTFASFLSMSSIFILNIRPSANIRFPESTTLQHGGSCLILRTNHFVKLQFVVVRNIQAR